MTVPHAHECRELAASLAVVGDQLFDPLNAMVEVHF
jgi:hypothetical protein